MTLVLDALPTVEAFFRLYWNKKPFLVRGLIPPETVTGLIDAGDLMELSMEEEVISRLVQKGPAPQDWRCDHGPFEAADFDGLGDADWSLLVQNTEQYFDGNAALLQHFNFSPRWLLDDIMVSYSPKGGTVGAHTDSYHVFLVQGKGERCWTVANAPIHTEDYIEDIPLKILRDGFDGEELTVREGDVIYIPPHFAHQGVSIKPSLTYSVGFLGPSLSEMLIEFGQYIEENHKEIPRYIGADLNHNAAPFSVGSQHIGDLKHFMTGIFDDDLFTRWLAQYFANPAHILDDEAYDDEEDGDEEISFDAATAMQTEGLTATKHPSIKIMLTPLAGQQKYAVAAGTMAFDLGSDALFLVDAMATEAPFPITLFTDHIDLLQDLVDHQVLTIDKIESVDRV